MVKAQTDTFWATLTGGFFASVAYLMGGVDNLLICLSILMIVDYVTGVMIGFLDKQVSSQRAYRGIAKKVTMLLFIIVANQVDIIFSSQNGELRYYILMLLIATEGISLSENFGKLGLPIPAIWTNALEVIRQRSGGSETVTVVLEEKTAEQPTKGEVK
ncbi:holin [Bacillus phage 035JT001]|nr:holin [Bacillus phage 035JT001]